MFLQYVCSLTRNSNEILEYDVAVPTIDEGEDEEEFVNLGMKKKY
jgi:hypothetical protein